MDLIVSWRRTLPATMATAFGLGSAVAITSAYGLIFLPLLPLSQVAVNFYGLGLLPLSPIIAFGMTIRQVAVRTLRRRQ